MKDFKETRTNLDAVMVRNYGMNKMNINQEQHIIGLLNTILSN